MSLTQVVLRDDNSSDPFLTFYYDDTKQKLADIDLKTIGHILDSKIDFDISKKPLIFRYSGVHNDQDFIACEYDGVLTIFSDIDYATDEELDALAIEVKKTDLTANLASMEVAISALQTEQNIANVFPLRLIQEIPTPVKPKEKYNKSEALILLPKFQPLLNNLSSQVREEKSQAIDEVIEQNKKRYNELHAIMLNNENHAIILNGEVWAEFLRAQVKPLMIEIDNANIQLNELKKSLTLLTKNVLTALKKEADIRLATVVSAKAELLKLVHKAILQYWIFLLNQNRDIEQSALELFNKVVADFASVDANEERFVPPLQLSSLAAALDLKTIRDKINTLITTSLNEIPELGVFFKKHLWSSPEVDLSQKLFCLDEKHVFNWVENNYDTSTFEKDLMAFNASYNLLIQKSETFQNSITEILDTKKTLIETSLPEIKNLHETALPLVNNVKEESAAIEVQFTTLEKEYNEQIGTAETLKLSVKPVKTLFEHLTQKLHTLMDAARNVIIKFEGILGAKAFNAAEIASTHTLNHLQIYNNAVISYKKSVDHVTSEVAKLKTTVEANDKQVIVVRPVAEKEPNTNNDATYIEMLKTLKTMLVEDISFLNKYTYMFFGFGGQRTVLNSKLKVQRGSAEMIALVAPVNCDNGTGEQAKTILAAIQATALATQSRNHEGIRCTRRPLINDMYKLISVSIDIDNPGKMDVKDLIAKAAKINVNWKFKQPAENSICSVTEKPEDSQVSAAITARY